MARTSFLLRSASRAARCLRMRARSALEFLACWSTTPVRPTRSDLVFLKLAVTVLVSTERRAPKFFFGPARAAAAFAEYLPMFFLRAALVMDCFSWMEAILAYMPVVAFVRSLAASRAFRADCERMAVTARWVERARDATSSAAAHLFSLRRARSLPRARLESEYRLLASATTRLSSAPTRRFTRTWFAFWLMTSPDTTAISPERRVS